MTSVVSTPNVNVKRFEKYMYLLITVPMVTFMLLIIGNVIVITHNVTPRDVTLSEFIYASILKNVESGRLTPTEITSLYEHYITNVMMTSPSWRATMFFSFIASLVFIALVALVVFPMLYAHHTATRSFTTLVLIWVIMFIITYMTTASFVSYYHWHILRPGPHLYISRLLGI